MPRFAYAGIEALAQMSELGLCREEYGKCILVSAKSPGRVSPAAAKGCVAPAYVVKAYFIAAAFGHYGIALARR